MSDRVGRQREHGGAVSPMVPGGAKGGRSEGIRAMGQGGVTVSVVEGGVRGSTCPGVAGSLRWIHATVDEEKQRGRRGTAETG